MSSADEEDDDFVQVSAVPGKGLGVVAARDIEPGELIIREKPLLSLPLNEDGNLQGHTDQKTLEFRSFILEKELNKLSDSQLISFYSLSDAFSRQTCSISKTNFGIVKTNCFSVSYKADHTRLVLFPRIARINHSCVPNCHHYWSNQDQTFAVRAVEQIPRGQEICISYMSPLQRADFHATESRRKILHDEFGFKCLCEKCHHSCAKDDAKRERILEIETEWSELGSNPEAAMEMGQEQCRLCEELGFQAGLLAYVSLHCVEAASLMVAKKHKTAGCIQAEEFRTKGVQYAAKAAKYGKVAYGEDSDEFEIFQLVLKICETSSNSDLLTEIQAAITALRDIDS